MKPSLSCKPNHRVDRRETPFLLSIVLIVSRSHLTFPGAELYRYITPSEFSASTPPSGHGVTDVSPAGYRRSQQGIQVRIQSRRLEQAPAGVAAVSGRRPHP